MDDFATRSYGTSVRDNRPLFGETSAREVECDYRLHESAPPPKVDMDDFVTRSYGTSVQDNRPLFGETSARKELQMLDKSKIDKNTGETQQDRIINIVVGFLTSLLLLVTIISAFVFPQLPPKPLNIFFAVCIVLSCTSIAVLICWYRQGDLEPKFRNLIYYNLFCILLLCICANLYFHDVGK